MSRTVIVTGAANGIGQCIATRYAQEGHAVLLLDKDAAQGRRLVQQLQDQQLQAFFYPVDLQYPDQIHAVYSQLLANHAPPDILINNAGISRFTPLSQLTLTEYDEILAVNLRAPLYLAQLFAAHCRSGGRIVNIASTRAVMSEPASEAYAASKGGLISLTHALAVSLSNTGITVNAILPGWIATSGYETLLPADHRQHPAGRVGKPEDVARACLFLTAATSDFITGQCLTVDGGMTKKMIYTD